ncbi:MAG: hypothetical protein KGI37_09340 [Alphaproteobacteria bacterium]|nr:hypothetical protein [Alphaproteobacteria bacterium]
MTDDITRDEIFYMETDRGDTIVHVMRDGRLIEIKSPRPLIELADQFDLVPFLDDDNRGFAVNFFNVLATTLLPYKKLPFDSAIRDVEAGSLTGDSKRPRFIREDDKTIVDCTSVMFRNGDNVVFPVAVDILDTVRRAQTRPNPPRGKPDNDPNPA